MLNIRLGMSRMHWHGFGVPVISYRASEIRIPILLTHLAGGGEEEEAEQEREIVCTGTPC